MTEWSSIEFASTAPISRKAQDFFPVLGNFLTVWDFLTCVLAGHATLLLYTRYVLAKPMALSASGPFWRDILFGSLIAALVLRDSSGQSAWKSGSRLRCVLHAERRCGLAFAVLIIVGLVTRATDDLARLWLVSWFVVFATIVAVTRFVSGTYLQRLHGRGKLRENIAIVGSAGIRDRLAGRIASDATIVGTFGAHAWDESARHETDDLASLFELGRDGSVDSVILALEHGHKFNVPHVIQRLKSLPVQVVVCSEDGWSSPAAPQMRLLGGLPMAVVADRPIKRWNLLIKTVLDKMGAFFLLVLLSPLLLAIAIVVGLTSPGPIIFRQRRQGWCGQDFVVLKFRTMRVPAEEDRHLLQTEPNDKRCTRVGRVLRRCSLDELPQLWNVLRGEMSLVGLYLFAENLHEMDPAEREVVAEYRQQDSS